MVFCRAFVFCGCVVVDLDLSSIYSRQREYYHYL